MAKIKLKCEGCGIINDLNRTSDISEEIKSMTCNWCPLCEDDNATTDYTETHHANDRFNESDPNQLKIEL